MRPFIRLDLRKMRREVRIAVDSAPGRVVVEKGKSGRNLLPS